VLRTSAHIFSRVLRLWHHSTRTTILTRMTGTRTYTPRDTSRDLTTLSSSSSKLQATHGNYIQNSTIFTSKTPQILTIQFRL